MCRLSSKIKAKINRTRKTLRTQKNLILLFVKYSWKFECKYYLELYSRILLEYSRTLTRTLFQLYMQNFDTEIL